MLKFCSRRVTVPPVSISGGATGLLLIHHQRCAYAAPASNSSTQRKKAAAQQQQRIKLNQNQAMLAEASDMIERFIMWQLKEDPKKKKSAADAASMPGFQSHQHQVELSKRPFIHSLVFGNAPSAENRAVRGLGITVVVAFLIWQFYDIVRAYREDQRKKKIAELTKEKQYGEGEEKPQVVEFSDAEDESLWSVKRNEERFVPVPVVEPSARRQPASQNGDGLSLKLADDAVVPFAAVSSTALEQSGGRSHRSSGPEVVVVKSSSSSLPPAEEFAALHHQQQQKQKVAAAKTSPFEQAAPPAADDSSTMSSSPLFAHPVQPQSVLQQQGRGRPHVDPEENPVRARELGLLPPLTGSSRGAGAGSSSNRGASSSSSSMLPDQLLAAYMPALGTVLVSGGCAVAAVAAGCLLLLPKAS